MMAMSPGYSALIHALAPAMAAAALACLRQDLMADFNFELFEAFDAA